MYEQLIKKFVFHGSNITIDNKLLITVAGLKHFFSSFITVRILENKLEMDWKHSKFLNWFLKFDFDTFILKANNGIDFLKFAHFVRFLQLVKLIVI